MPKVTTTAKPTVVDSQMMKAIFTCKPKNEKL